MKATQGWASLVAALAIVTAAPAVAELLVTRDGLVIEILGGWEVRGKLLVFELPDGTLASLRLEEADLEASQERNRAAEERARRERQASPRSPPQPVEATVVLTDRDVAPAPPLVGEGSPEGAAERSDAVDTGGGEAAAGERAEESRTGGVQVVEWSQEPEGETGMAVRGVIQNLGSSFATGLSLNALFYDEAGTLVAAREVALEDGPLGPGARREFSLTLSDSLVFAEIKFLVVGRGFRSVGQNVPAPGRG